MSWGSWKWWLLIGVLPVVTGVLAEGVRRHVDAANSSGIDPAIRARMDYMDAVSDVAAPVCREPGNARAAHLAALQREHRAFDIACSEDSVSVSVRPERDERAFGDPAP
jgi:hypothetical protein